jgi:LmbE family N-acetylglucosaminyl deacetylase
VNTNTEKFGKVLVLVAHPDDETIGCSGLLQRASSALVVFAVDGSPPHYGFENKYGSLQRYSDIRFLEADVALKTLSHCSFRRLASQSGAHFVDQHLFDRMSEALTSLNQFVCRFSPDLIVTHAFEGGHIDHDACHVLAAHIARAYSLMVMEFPSYWKADDGRDMFQQFRNHRNDEVVLRLSEHEIEVKRQMLASYRTQQVLTSVFHLHTERFRPALQEREKECTWANYAFENRRRRLKATLFLEKVEELNRSALASDRLISNESETKPSNS